MHVHVEYEWRLRQEDLYESDDELDDKVGISTHAKSVADKLAPPNGRQFAAQAKRNGSLQ